MVKLGVEVGWDSIAYSGGGDGGVICYGGDGDGRGADVLVVAKGVWT